MFKLRKKNTSADDRIAPLVLHAAEGTLHRTFEPETVDSFRRTITDLSHSADLPRRIAIISALKGEGVTYSTLALATVLASDMNKSVCVVDLNWWSPSLAHQLDPVFNVKQKRRRRKDPPLEPTAAAVELASRPGVAQVVDGTASLDEALYATDLPNLTLLSSGELPVARRPVLARSDGMKNLINELSERFDYLLFDIPAILNSSDAIALASYSDACCMVVRHGITPSTSVQRALDDVRHLRMLGVILNQVSIKTPRWIRELIPQE